MESAAPEAPLSSSPGQDQNTTGNAKCTADGEIRSLQGEASPPTITSTSADEKHNDTNHYANDDDTECNENSRLMSDQAHIGHQLRPASLPGVKDKLSLDGRSFKSQDGRLSSCTSDHHNGLFESDDDYKHKLLSMIGGDGIYNDTTIPYDIKASRERFFRDSNSRSRTPNELEAGNHDETKLDINLNDEPLRGKPPSAGNRTTSVPGDVIQSINNLRQNVNNQIIGGSKTVISRMRKLSITEHGKSAGKKYRIAFYGTLALLSLLFLYLIYQNLFNDR